MFKYLREPVVSALLAFDVLRDRLRAELHRRTAPGVTASIPFDNTHEKWERDLRRVLAL